MELKLTEDQYRKLVKLVFMGMWMTDSRGTEKDDPYFIEIEQLVYSASLKNGINDIIEYDKINDKYFPSENFDAEDIIAQHIDAYDENCFWDELIDRLTKRDMIEKYGLEKIHNMNQAEIFQKEKEIIDYYEEFFAKNGLKNLFFEKGWSI